MKRVRLVAASLPALALAGCGTTVSGTDAASNTAASGVTPGDSLSVPSTAAAGSGASTSAGGAVGSSSTGAGQANNHRYLWQRDRQLQPPYIERSRSRRTRRCRCHNQRLADPRRFRVTHARDVVSGSCDRWSWRFYASGAGLCRYGSGDAPKIPFRDQPRLSLGPEPIRCGATDPSGCRRAHNDRIPARAPVMSMMFPCAENAGFITMPDRCAKAYCNRRLRDLVGPVRAGYSPGA